MIRVAYNRDYVAAKYAFDTTRKARWIHDALAVRPYPNLQFADPEAWYPDALAGIDAVHDPAYVAAVATGEPRERAESQGFDWDPGLYRGAVASTAGVLAAIDWALEDGAAGSLSSGLHHAKYDRGDGFCTFNGLAVGAWYLRQRGVDEVAILDVDAHAGGGTVSLIGSDVKHFDVTVSPFDTYEFGGTRNVVLSDPTDEEYLTTVASMLAAVPDGAFLLYNAGMDPAGIVSGAALRAREALVASEARRRGLRAAFVLAGGYTWAQSREALVRAHMWTLEAFADASVREPASAPS